MLVYELWFAVMTRSLFLRWTHPSRRHSIISPSSFYYIGATSFPKQIKNVFLPITRIATNKFSLLRPKQNPIWTELFPPFYRSKHGVLSLWEVILPWWEFPMWGKAVLFATFNEKATTLNEVGYQISFLLSPMKHISVNFTNREQSFSGWNSRSDQTRGGDESTQRAWRIYVRYTWNFHSIHPRSRSGVENGIVW